MQVKGHPPLANAQDEDLVDMTDRSYNDRETFNKFTDSRPTLMIKDLFTLIVQGRFEKGALLRPFASSRSSRSCDSLVL